MEPPAPSVPRRRLAWGSLLADAPWDGRAKAPTPLRIPMTEAVRMPTPPGPGHAPHNPKHRRRAPFGRLLADCPWAGVRPEADTPEDQS